MSLVYLVLSIVGFVLPYSQLVPFFINNGLDLPLFWSQLFANHISSDFAFDLLISSVVFWLFVFREGTRLHLKFLWVYLVLNLVVGLSFALPLFFWVRSRHLATELLEEAT